MAELKVHKVVSALPQTLEADSIYLVRAGDGFDLYTTNHGGTIISYKANYQQKSANLAALAGLLGSANKMFYFTAESAMALADLTVFGRLLNAAADAPAARSTLGLGTAATRNVGTGGFDLVENQALGTAARKNVTSSAVDTTADRVMRTGDGGWMGDVPVQLAFSVDDRTLRGWRYVSVAGGTVGTLPDGVVFGQIHTFGNTGDIVCQEFWTFAPPLPPRRYHRQCFGSDAWGRWVKDVSPQDTAAYPFVNLMADNGRWAGKIDPVATLFTQAFTANTWFPGYNGTTLASGGKFIYDNSTNGGVAGALTEPVQSLLLAQGRSLDVRRYGVEFYVATATAGAGTTVASTGADGVNRYLTFAMQKAIAASDSYGTYVGWIRVRSGSTHIAARCFVDGVEQQAGYVLTPGWHHMRIVMKNVYGYFGNMPYLYSAPGSVIDLALPAYFSGAVDVGVHFSPIPSANGASPA